MPPRGERRFGRFFVIWIAHRRGRHRRGFFKLFLRAWLPPICVRYAAVAFVAFIRNTCCSTARQVDLRGVLQTAVRLVRSPWGRVPTRQQGPSGPVGCLDLRGASCPERASAQLRGVLRG